MGWLSFAKIIRSGSNTFMIFELSSQKCWSLISWVFTQIIRKSKKLHFLLEVDTHDGINFGVLFFDIMEKREIDLFFYFFEGHIFKDNASKCLPNDTHAFFHKMILICIVRLAVVSSSNNINHNCSSFYDFSTAFWRYL